MTMDGGDHFKFEDGVSLFVGCKDQAEVDYYWGALTVEDGASGQCGWCKDKFGLSWQVVPMSMEDLMRRPYVFAKMLDMKKIVIADF
jgi:predicted 3-demethylubiquinone-9 3-methyltransferase (glyoxalase superfamily)